MLWSCIEIIEYHTYLRGISNHHSFLCRLFVKSDVKISVHHRTKVGIKKKSFSGWLLLRFEMQMLSGSYNCTRSFVEVFLFLSSKHSYPHSCFVCREKRRFEIYSLSILRHFTSPHSCRFILAIAIEAFLTFFSVYRITLCFLHFSTEKDDAEADS